MLINTYLPLISAMILWGFFKTGSEALYLVFIVATFLSGTFQLVILYHTLIKRNSIKEFLSLFPKEKLSKGIIYKIFSYVVMLLPFPSIIYLTISIAEWELAIIWTIYFLMLIFIMYNLYNIKKEVLYLINNEEQE